jgi:hypothetical protein
MANRTTTQSGAINTASTWSGTLPASTDTVTFAYANTISDGDSLTYATGTLSVAGTLTYSGTASATLTFTSGFGSQNELGMTVNGSGGALVINGNIVAATIDSHAMTVSTGGFVTINGNVSVASAAGSAAVGINITQTAIGQIVTINGNIDGNAAIGVWLGGGAGFSFAAPCSPLIVNGSITASGEGGTGVYLSGGLLQHTGNVNMANATGGATGVQLFGASTYVHTAGTVNGPSNPDNGDGVATSNGFNWWIGNDAELAGGSNFLDTGDVRYILPTPANVRGGEVYWDGSLTGSSNTAAGSYAKFATAGAVVGQAALFEGTQPQ